MNNIFNMNTEELRETLCKIAEPVGRIAQDEKVAEAFKKIAKVYEENRIVFALYGAVFSNLVPLLLGEYKEDTFCILSAVTGKSIEQLNNENGLQIAKDIYNLFNKEMLTFFTSSAATE